MCVCVCCPTLFPAFVCVFVLPRPISDLCVCVSCPTLFLVYVYVCVLPCPISSLCVCVCVALPYFRPLCVCLALPYFWLVCVCVSCLALFPASIYVNVSCPTLFLTFVCVCVLPCPVFDLYGTWANFFT